MENKDKTFLYIALGLNIIGVLFDLYCMFIYKWFKLKLIISTIGYISVAYYLAVGYKKPHGNLLKIVMTQFSVNTALIGLSTDVKAFQYCLVFASLFNMHMCGRLHKIKENTIYSILIIALLIIAVTVNPISLAQEATATVVLTSLGSIVQFVAIVIAYFVRYKQHREAGLMEDNK